MASKQMREIDALQFLAGHLSNCVKMMSENDKAFFFASEDRRQAAILAFRTLGHVRTAEELATPKPEEAV